MVLSHLPITVDFAKSDFFLTRNEFDIRFDHQVFILFSRKRNMFRILGDEQENAETAMQRIHDVFCEFAAKKNSKWNRMCLVAPLRDASAI
jgi:hypothetical protein